MVVVIFMDGKKNFVKKWKKMKIDDINRLFKASELLERAAKEIEKVYANTNSFSLAYNLGDVQHRATVLFNEALDEYEALSEDDKKNYDKKYKQSWK